MRGRGHLSEGHGPREMSPTQQALSEGGKNGGLNLVNSSALAILVVRGAAERFATLCVWGCFVF